MDIQQLLTFQKLAKEQSFKRASQELGISQPTVTMRIKALESELGETLFLRTGQKATLTPIGKLYLSYVDRALKIYQSGKDRMAAGELNTCLTIAGTPTFNTYVLPELLKKFADTDNQIEWRIYTEHSDRIVQMIVDGIADIGFIRGMIHAPNTHTYSLYSEELVLVASSRYPLRQNESISLGEIRSEPLIIYRRESETWSIIEERFHSLGLIPKIGMELSHVFAVKQMVTAGMGLAFLPEITIADDIKKGVLNKITIEGPPLIRQTSIVIPVKSADPAVSAFIKFIHERFPSASISNEVALLLS